jgi:putative radical SAM enzyme (TIGR03279 family)
LVLREHIIKEVYDGSIAQELQLEPGDVLVSINDRDIKDIFDYHFFVSDEVVTLLVRKKNGEEWELEIDKEMDEDLGLGFENGLMDNYQSCQNHCVFCFIDQMPKGMRETLYFKDDDARLSFLQGNYVTLTNMKDCDVERIIELGLGPINISVHTTNPSLRQKMLNNRFAGQALGKMERLFEAGILMNGQIVLCKGLNDGEELERSIRDLKKFLPVMQSVSVVPVGLSKYRDGLYSLEPFLKEDAVLVLQIIRQQQQRCLDEFGVHFVHASDEWYLLAQQDLPLEACYDGYPQLENGVGMLRLLAEEFYQALTVSEDRPGESVVSIGTGVLAAPFIRRLADDFEARFWGRKVHVLPVVNHFFGEQITVSGLLTGQDIITQLQGQELGERLLLPCNMLRHEEQVFLDDVTLGQVKKALQVPVDIVESNGQHLLKCMLCERSEVENE